MDGIWLGEREREVYGHYEFGYRDCKWAYREKGRFRGSESILEREVEMLTG